MITQRHSLGLLAGALILNLLAAPVMAATLELTGPTGVTVSINDRPMGQFPLDGPLDLPPGNYDIMCQVKGYAPYHQKVRLATITEWQRVTVRLSPYSRQTAWTSNILLAGMGQHYVDASFRGYVYNITEAGGLLTALAAELQRSNFNSDYQKLARAYNTELNADELVRLRLEADVKYSDMKDMEELRDLGLMIAGGAVVISILDVLLTFPGIEGGAGQLPLDTSSVETPWSENETSHALHASVRLKF